mmetsp:Transcript_13937/g.31731  ORF Transcript_13937/g.31731 Transcript_13937/m.31731 type:complete len:83 (-) Transcript_13937:330-578(-)
MDHSVARRNVKRWRFYDDIGVIDHDGRASGDGNSITLEVSSESEAVRQVVGKHLALYKVVAEYILELRLPLRIKKLRHKRLG